MKKAKFFSKSIKPLIFLLLVAAMAYFGYQAYAKFVYEKRILKQMIARLQNDSRIAEVLVTEASYNPITQTHDTTIKFLEFDSLGQPMAPRYFTFQNNIIQFQSLVARFADKFVTEGDALRGKSVYLFWKAFVLDGANTKEYVITPVNQVPQGYKIDGLRSAFEENIWKEFWDYALNSKKAVKKGIKNAQIEAPGTKFVPGILYTLKIEHDGGIRIDAIEIPPILKGEKVLLY